jgi:hypothetical protein
MRWAGRQCCRRLGAEPRRHAAQSGGHAGWPRRPRPDINVALLAGALLTESTTRSWLGTARGTAAQIVVPAQWECAEQRAVVSVQVAHAVHRAVLLVNGRSVVLAVTLSGQVKRMLRSPRRSRMHSASVVPKSYRSAVSRSADRQLGLPGEQRVRCHKHRQYRNLGRSEVPSMYWFAAMW